MDEDELLEPDQVEGAPHPRATPRLFGQLDAQDTFLKAYAMDRIHHAWMLVGPQGVGKATLAWRIARFLLAQPCDAGGGLLEPAPVPTSLDIAADHPVSRRILAGSEAGLFLLRRSYDEKKRRYHKEITVAEVRRLKDFFHLTAPDGGWRVVIVDAVDEMNISAANALLKILEEPPKRSVILLVTHQPSGVLATIRSRCRTLRLLPLGPEPMAEALAQAGLSDPAPGLAELAQGSVGYALQLAQLEGMELYQTLIELFSTYPQLDREAIIALADSVVPKGAEARLFLLLDLLDVFLSRLAYSGATGKVGLEVVPGEAALLRRMCPDLDSARAWAEFQQTAIGRMRQGLSVNIDPKALVLDTCFSMETAVRNLKRP